MNNKYSLPVLLQLQEYSGVMEVLFVTHRITSLTGKHCPSRKPTLRVTEPLCLYKSPMREERREDLPAPTDPTTATREPSLTRRLIS